jgi:O-antigen/teichoic acid export membrane protein
MAILDQGIFSVSNFILNILLSRWLVPADNGAFSVVFAIFLYLDCFHSAILQEPMSVIGSVNYPEWMGAYLHRQI